VYSTEHLENNLKKCVPENYADYFVAAAVKINDEKTASHAGLIVKCDEGVFLCHFDGENILIEEPSEDWYFYKIFEFIDKRLSSALLAQCKNIKETSNPLYGCYYEGSFYNNDGIYFSSVSKKEFMTCVGFCLNVLKGFLCEDDEEFFKYSDWTKADLPNWYLEQFAQKLKLYHPKANIESLKENIRRIKPSEYLASSYLDSYPIERKQINKFLDELIKVIAGKVENN
jgi:hypothetical protein